MPTFANKYIEDCEYILHFRKGAKCKPENYTDAQTVYFGSINIKDKKKYGHPTIKPLPLVEKLIRNHTSKGQIVFDPFMVSGTMGVASKNMDRNFMGIELNKEYFEIAEKRLNGFYDKKEF